MGSSHQPIDDLSWVDFTDPDMWISGVARTSARGEMRTGSLETELWGMTRMTRHWGVLELEVEEILAVSESDIEPVPLNIIAKDHMDDGYGLPFCDLGKTTLQASANVASQLSVPSGVNYYHYAEQMGMFEVFFYRVDNGDLYVNQDVEIEIKLKLRGVEPALTVLIDWEDM
jgi:hypothetical protein